MRSGEDSGWLEVFMFVVVILLLVGVAVMGYRGGHQQGRHEAEIEHRQAVFDEQVTKHDCKLQKVWVDGKAVEGKTCILPDGTILQRGD